MQLILTSYGSYIHKAGELFKIKTGEQETEVPANKVTSILVGTAATFSTDAVELAVEKNIDIIFLNKFGDPFGRIWHGRLGSTARIRRAQLRLSEMEEGFILARGWILKKFDNQIGFLETLRSRRTRLSSEFTLRINQLKQLRLDASSLSGTMDLQRQTLLGIEGAAGRFYFDGLNFALAEKYKYAGRSRNPAKDEFNCLLNYAYGVLYGQVERACILAGLDPYVGFFHTDHYNKPSLVFDLIENYRVWAEETIIALFAERKVVSDFFDKLEGGYRLNKEGKTGLLQPYLEYLDTSIRYHRRNIKRRDIVQFDCHAIAQQILKGLCDETG